MKSELTDEFIQCFSALPGIAKETARKNYKLWKQNPFHPSLEFKKLNTRQTAYSVRVGIGWRAVGVMKDSETIVWFWIGSHSNYDKLLKQLLSFVMRSRFMGMRFERAIAFRRD